MQFSFQPCVSIFSSIFANHNLPHSRIIQLVGTSWMISNEYHWFSLVIKFLSVLLRHMPKTQWTKYSKMTHTRLLFWPFPSLSSCSWPCSEWFCFFSQQHHYAEVYKGYVGRKSGKLLCSTLVLWQLNQHLSLDHILDVFHWINSWQVDGIIVALALILGKKLLYSLKLSRSRSIFT